MDIYIYNIQSKLMVNGDEYMHSQSYMGLYAACNMAGSRQARS